MCNIENAGNGPGDEARLPQELGKHARLIVNSLTIFTMAECDIYTSREDAEEAQVVLSNLLYGSSEHQNGVSSQSAEPYRSYVDFSTTSPDHSSTLHVISNPIYGTQSPSPTTDGAYSAPEPVKQIQDYTIVTFKGEQDSEHEVVNTSGAVLVEISDSSQFDPV